MITLLYFASLRETLGLSTEKVELPAGASSVSTLVAVLHARGGKWPQALAEGRPWRVAVNQQMADASTPVKAGDEVAFFPPVTGG